MSVDPKATRQSLGLQWKTGISLPGVVTHPSQLRGLTRLSQRQQMELRHGGYAVIERTPKPLFVYPGDWVVYLSSNRPVVMSDIQFKTLFQE